jgi:hypothetical protein
MDFSPLVAFRSAINKHHFSGVDRHFTVQIRDVKRVLSDALTGVTVKQPTRTRKPRGIH